MTDINPESVACRMVGDLKLAIEMAKAHYPYLVGELEFTLKRYQETALTFVGSQNIPAGSRTLSGKDKED